MRFFHSRRFSHDRYDRYLGVRRQNRRCSVAGSRRRCARQIDGHQRLAQTIFEHRREIDVRFNHLVRLSCQLDLIRRNQSPRQRDFLGNGVLVVSLPLAKKGKPVQFNLTTVGISRGERVGSAGHPVKRTSTDKHLKAHQAP